MRATTSPPLLSVKAVSKRFAGHDALMDISLEVSEGEFVTLLGPSGCGKTTLLRCISGFLRPEAGSIAIDGEDVTGKPPYRRPLNTVFQNYALFPHLNVLDNVAYGPRRHGAKKTEALGRAKEALELVGLAAFAERHPRQLSGGQQQRVALARAVVNRPKLLLLDEPLSALDLKLRKRMQIELKHLQARLGIAFLFVTHDQEEALTMADRVVVMNGGRIEQIGRGMEIYRAPATRFVAEFIGEANFLACVPEGTTHLRPEIGTLAVPYAVRDTRAAFLGVLRPEHVEILASDDAPGMSVAQGTVEEIINVGSQTIIHLRVGDLLLMGRQSGMEKIGLKRGDRVTAGFRPQDLHIILEKRV